VLRTFGSAMGRPLRVHAADVHYHVTVRGVRQLRTYEDRRDYAKFEILLQKVVEKRGWNVHAYCQMPNHYHLVLDTPEADISDGMHWLNGVYARWFNERHGYFGHVFEARFQTKLILSNVHLLNVSTYVPLNPVRARLCANPADWRWSSYRASIGRERKPWLSSWLLEQFGREPRQAAIAYRRFVESQMAA
jgi:putative transposase